MKIANSSISMAATSQSVVTSTKQQNLQVWRGPRLQIQQMPAVRLDLSQWAKQQEQVAKQKDTSAVDAKADAPDKNEQKIKLLQRMLEKLTGKKIKFFSPEELKLSSEKVAALKAHAIQNAAARMPSFGMVYDSVETYSEQQSMSFQAAGVVQTADGRSIDFTVALSMSREFASQTEVHLRAGSAAVDPLVINFGGSAPALTERNFSFDLDNDGDKDQISFLQQGSGFLALDKNGDGQVNDGGELFGPSMGNGFEELATYDSDGNNWIDENDAVYDKLRVWTLDAAGNKQLLALGEKGIGAIYLGNVATGFDLKTAQNNTLGSIRSTGVFLNENGSAGTIQHIDLTV